MDDWYKLDPASMGAENHADAARAVSDPGVRHAMCEDYRAGLGVDRAADDADRRAGQGIIAPLLVVWGSRDDLAELYDHDPLAVWRPWATRLEGHAIDTGHHMMEEEPGLLADTLVNFLGR